MNYDPHMPKKPAKFDPYENFRAGLEMANCIERGLSEDTEPPTPSAYQEAIMRDLLTGGLASLGSIEPIGHGTRSQEAERVLRVFGTLLKSHAGFLDKIVTGKVRLKD